MPHSEASPQPHWIPTTRREADQLGWGKLDIVLISGDTLIDAPASGISVIARVLIDAGYKVGVIAQPDVNSDQDIGRFGEPHLFWGISAGALDSMVANYTAIGKPRRHDDLTPAGCNTRRPDRACIVYAQLVRRYFKNTRPIILGGVEASLRRISHYDVWSNSVRRSILFDARADILVYGMGEKTIVTLADRLQRNEDIRAIRGLCYIGQNGSIQDSLFSLPGMELPSHDAVSNDKSMFGKMFTVFDEHCDPYIDRPIYQKQDTRYLVQNPPALPLSPQELDWIHELPYTRKVHPYYNRQGPVTAMDTIAFSLSTHRGCYGQCRFCAIAAHQGKIIVSRSQSSLLREAATLSRLEDFKGIITDVGGATANMYGSTCGRKVSHAACARKACLFPTPCRMLKANHQRQIELLRSLRALPGIRKVFIGSGIRYDLIVQDRRYGSEYLTEIMKHHISGQMKIAPEHSQATVLNQMGKPKIEVIEEFHRLFATINQTLQKKVFLTYYLMAAHPGCTQADMQQLRRYAQRHWKVLPRQVQIFTPTPATYSTCMYYTGKNPLSGETIYVEKSLHAKQRQKAAIVKK